MGYGSIGKRHFEILKSFDAVSSIDVVTRQNLANQVTYEDLTDVEDLEVYDYFVISSVTSKHHEQLKHLCSKVNFKNILVEKPLYEKVYELFETNNKIFTAYNLRFHHVMQKLKELLRTQKVYYANVICGQYLPSWRPERDYANSYSAHATQGGGVLRDLSHELDYSTWLFGDVLKMDSISAKVSDLEIDSDDVFTAIMVTDKKTILNVTMDYLSKTPMRRLIIHTKETTIEADLINNRLVSYDVNANQSVLANSPKVDKNHSYVNMHRAILSGDAKDVCGFEEGLKIVRLIDKIKREEL